MKETGVKSINIRQSLLYCLFLFVTINCFGCATYENSRIGNRYIAIYNDAVSKDATKYIIKEGKFDDIWAKVKEILGSFGYKKTIYSASEQGFMVFVKDLNIGEALLIGNPDACKIIVKFTKAEEGATRIDLVKGSNVLATNKQVEGDIQKIYESIRKN